MINNYEIFLRRYFLAFGILLVALSFIMVPISETITGLIDIILTDDILITDYLAIGGIGGTFLNVGLVVLLTLYIVIRCDITLSGFHFAAMFILTGFSFFGKNIYNILPIYLGVYLYSRYMNEPYKKFFTVAIFATCLAPIVGTNFIGGYIGSFVSAILGIFYGFTIVPLASHVIRFHNGFTLFNVGFAGGLFALVLSSVMRVFGIELVSVRHISTEYHLVLTLFTFVLSTFFLLLAISSKTVTHKSYRRLLKKTGRSLTDYFQMFKAGNVYLNVAIMGYFCLSITLLLGIPMNGPIFGAVLTVMGFSAFGMSILNALPVVGGCIAMMFITGVQIETEYVMMALFVMALSPIAGHYGIWVGLLAGALHFSVVSYSANWQGSLNLYNNGFASGLVAGIIVSILDNFKKV